MLKSHVFLESKNHRVRCAPPVRHCPAGPPARKRTRGGTSGSNRGPASRTTGRRTRGGTGGSNRGPASRTTAPLANEICNLQFEISNFSTENFEKKLSSEKFSLDLRSLLSPLFKREGGGKGRGGGAGRAVTSRVDVAANCDHSSATSHRYFTKKHSKTTQNTLTKHDF